jgi:hypothetical protein
MEGTVQKCDVYGLQGFLELKAHLVKLGVWNQSSVLDIHHGNHTYIDLCIHS